MKECVVGIDTSNYTTSLSIVSHGRVLVNGKAPLPVKEGECGLRQSDALFAHVKNMPALAELLRKEMADKRVLAVGVSEKPRNREGSYMPCFLGGVAMAETVAAALQVPLYRFSHQCGHLRAALYSADAEHLLSRPFGAFHISGGTTELLLVTPKDGAFACEIVGGTKDLNGGQLVDRIGVALGLSFPCGVALETLAFENKKKIPARKIKTEQGYVHLSGLENVAQALYRETGDKALTAAAVFRYLSDAVIGMSRDFRALYGDLPLLYAGGVMSNTIIRERVTSEISNAYFAEPAFSSDNGAGIALLTEERFRAIAK